MMYRNITETTELGACALGAMVDVSPENEYAIALLKSVRDSVIEATTEYDPEDWNREMVEDYSGRATEIADGAPSVYTWRKWQEFTGLGAWSEDVSEYGPVEDLDTGATLAVYIIARRLVSAIAEEIAPEDADQ
jgi:hypothetical protein